MENIPNVSIVFWNIYFVHLYMKLRKSNEVHLNSMYCVGQRFPSFLTRGALFRINFYGGAP